MSTKFLQRRPAAVAVRCRRACPPCVQTCRHSAALHQPAAYDKRKYMWKLLYTRLLGYDVDFGVKNASDLIAAPGCAGQQLYLLSSCGGLCHAASPWR